ncbi:MAG: SRPBCC family protein [Euryarchaeota archaeon]|nr:SRPBCC family protein [Euryarchaeota archaeon]
MVTIDKSVEAKVGVETAWNCLARFDFMPRWMPGALKCASIDATQTGLGARYHNESEVCGTLVSWDLEVSEWKPHKRLGWVQASGGFQRYSGSYDLSPTKDATLIRLRLDFELPGVMDRLVTENQAVREYNRELDDALLNLKDFLESGRTF